jgi:hypothetical protein
MGRSVRRGEQPFYVQEWSDSGERPKPVGHEDLGKNWVGAGHLKVGDKIKQADGTTGVVANVLTLQQTREMFNLTVSEAQTYYVGNDGWLVHNVSCPTLISRIPRTGGNLTVMPGRYTQSEMDAASKLSAYGNDVMIRPASGRGRLSDLVVNGNPYDVYTPQGGTLDSILRNAASKNTQATGIVIDILNARSLFGGYSEARILTRIRELGAKNIQDIIILGR